LSVKINIDYNRLGAPKMVSAMWALIFFSFGLLIYLGVPALGGVMPLQWRLAIGSWYYSMSLRSFRKLALVRRILGGYELLPIDVDDEEMSAQVTLSSGLLSDDKNLPFKDPLNVVKRLHKKPATLLIEKVPAAIDAELAEIGYWTEQKAIDVGLEDQEKVDPFIDVSRGLRVADPVDALNVVSKDISPENIKTAKEMTKRRFEKYGSNVGMVEGVATFMGFAVGIGGTVFIWYLKNKSAVTSGGGGQPVNPAPPIGGMQAMQPLVDALMVML
jgi:hypothetical protein